MNRDQSIASIAEEIERLQRAKELLTEANLPAPRIIGGHKGKSRQFSAEARARIAAAQKRRWAKEKR